MDSQAIEAIATRWVVRRHDEAWSDSDEAAFQQWLQASTAHRVSYLRAEAVWNQIGRLQALGAGLPPGVVPERKTWPDTVTGPPEPNIHDGPRAPGQRAPRWRTLSTWARRGRLAAAAMAVLVAGAGAYLALDHWRGTRYSTQIGAMQSVVLADGSKMTLNTNTAVRVLLGESQRRIELEHGEAFFAVAKDPSRPFVVDVANKTVVAVGTEFSVRRESDDVQVVVTEGRVNLTPAASDARSEPTPLAAGAIAHTLDKRVLVNRQSVSEAEQLLSWRSGFLSFHDTPLAEAVAEFNRYNQRKIVIADTSIAGFLVGGSFRPNNAEAFLWLLERGFPVEVQWAASNITLTHR